MSLTLKYIPEYKYNHQFMGSIIDALFAVDTLEKYYLNNTTAYEDSIVAMSINLLKELSSLLQRTHDVDEDEPYCFRQDGTDLLIYNYNTIVHADINLIYKIVDFK